MCHPTGRPAAALPLITLQITTVHYRPYDEPGDAPGTVLLSAEQLAEGDAALQAASDVLSAGFEVHCCVGSSLQPTLP